MKITVLKDDGEEIVFNDVTDASLIVRQFMPVSKNGEVEWALLCQGFSWGANLRELVKEMRQSAHEIQKILDDRNT